MAPTADGTRPQQDEAAPEAPPLPDNEEALGAEPADKFDEDDEFAPPLPPDGGYGWVIVFSSFMINAIVDGFVYSFGIFFPVLYTYFNESKGKTAWIASLLPGVYLLIGPLVSALVNKYGARPVTITGCLVATTFFVISTFATSVDTLIFTWGFMGGIGFGLMYLPSLVIVGHYFAKRRSMATGLATCGSGIGTFAIAELTKLLISLYGWRGSLLILAGVVLNGVVFATFFRPLEARRPRSKMADEPKSNIMTKIAQEKTRNRAVSTGSLDGCLITNDNTIVADPSKVHFKTLVISEMEVDCSAAGQPRNGGVSVSGSKSSLQGVGQSPSVSRKTTPGDHGEIYNKQLERLRRPELGSRDRKISNISSYSTSSQRSLDQRKKDAARPMYRQDILYSGSVTNIAEYQSNPNMASFVDSVTALPADGDDGASRCAPCTNVVKANLDFNLFRSATFNVLCLNAFLSFLGFFTPFIYIADFAIDAGYTPSQGALLIQIIGICNIVGRLSAGWMADRPWADCIIIQNLSLLIAGISTMMVPFIKYYWLLCVYTVVFGCCIASFIALRTIVTVELMGLSKLNNAFGLIILFQGLAGIVGAPLAGFIFDSTGSYTISFMLAGFLIALSGLVTIPSRRISRWEHRRAREKMAGYSYVPPPPSDDDEEMRGSSYSGGDGKV